MKFIKPFLIIMLALLAMAAQAQQYQATVTHSEWRFSGNRVGCFLSHDIPQYGVGVFEQRSGEPLSFVLTAESYVPTMKMATLSSTPPVWMHGSPALKLASIPANKQRLIVNNDLSERMLQELSSGRFPAFNYTAKAAGQKVNVVVSSINFLQAMEPFEACRQKLLPFSRNEVHQNLSLFNNLGTDISHKNRRFLNKAVSYINEAGEGERIDLIAGTDGFSVKDGRRMHNRRVKRIRQFLMEQGVADEQIMALDDPEEVDTPAGSVRLKIAGPEPFKHIYFHSGSIRLSRRDNRKLDYLLEYISLRKPGADIVLTGHSDSEGPRQTNMAVSKKRVAVIKKYLLSKGVTAERIISRARGESRPTATNRYPTGRQLNRRVDISISG
ncbi:MAG: OmpA family protein [Cycloclasticus sp.]